jgi:glycosyltransferase involved in cell wall biosynthesis/Tfp pilus assembly protein PilF
MKGPSVAPLTSLLDRFRQTPEGGADKAALLRDADAARDRREWSTAATLYKQYLELSPDHCAIWVQLGHALKDDKKFDLAIEAYKHALMLDPNDSDVYMNLGHAHKDDKNVGLAIEAYKQALALNTNDFDIYVNLGHAYKVASDMASAHQAYRKALELNPACSDAARELGGHLLWSGFADSASPDVEVTGPTIYLDVTDLIDYVKQENITLSGIQRVVANLVLETKRYEIASGSRVALTVNEYDLGKFFEVDRVVVTSLISALQSGGKTRKDIDEVVRAVYATRRPVEPRSGDDFAIPGAFWIYPNYDAIKRMRANGVRFTLFIHDLIQISHPQFVFEAANKRFRQALVDALMLADLVITNSEYVANEVRKFMSSRLNFSVPVKPALLATVLVGQQNQISQPARRDVRTAVSSPFVLSVATIEVRKNHVYMIKLWEELIAKGVKNIPNLVFVGKLGWDVEPLMKYIDQSGHLDGRLHILSNVSDHELTYLYEKCLFTMFPSFVEGFGLPVGESLAHGKPCIASNRSSMPEVGGRFVKYVSPEDVESGVRLVEELLADPTALSTWENEIKEEYKPRTWSEFTADFYDSIRQQKDSPSCSTNLVCDAGEIYSFGFSALSERDTRKQKLVYCSSALDANWYFAEDWGAWMGKRRAGILFRTRYAPGDVAAVYLELQLANETPPSSARFSVRSDGEPVEVCYFESRRQWFVFEVPVGVQGEVDIEIVAMGEFNPVEGGRQVYLGARRLCCCKADDYAARIRMVEKLTLLSLATERDGLRNMAV